MFSSAYLLRVGLQGGLDLGNIDYGVGSFGNPGVGQGRLLGAQIWKYAAATMLLVVSLLGVIVQDISLAMIASQLAALGTAPLILQGLVLLVCVGLVQLARTAETQGWIGAAKPSPLKRG